MVLSRTSIRALLRKMNNEQLIVDVLNKLKLNNTLTLKEIIEPLTDPKDMQQTNTSKRVLNKFWIESPALKKRVRSSEEFQQNMLNSFETNNPFEQNFTFENKESNNLLDALVDKFNIWKEIEEEPEKRRNGIEEDDQNHMNRLFNVDDFFS